MKVHPITLPAFGSIIPGQGGHFAAIMRGAIMDGIEQPPFALLVSDAIVGETKAKWGEYGKDVPAKSRTDGKANTDAMVLDGCPAAIKVREMTIGGHSDWYLPSLGELNSAASNVAELFSTDGYYWTSTQYSSINAFVQDFEIGYSYWDFKDDERRARAFRRISLDLLNT